MKTYNSEREFVENFAKDVKSGENQFIVNGKTFVCTGKQTNKHGQSEYMTDLREKAVTITALKKILGISWTAERATSGENKAEKTTFVTKTDEDLQATAKNIITSVFDNFRKSLKTCEKYGLSFDEMHALFKSDSVSRAEEIAFAGLKDKQLAILRKKAEREQAAQNKAKEEAKDKAAKAIAAMQAAGLSADEIKSMLGL